MKRFDPTIELRDFAFGVENGFGPEDATVVLEYVERLRAACKLAMPVLTRYVELQHGYDIPPYVNASQASVARDAVIEALEGDE